MKNVVAAIIVLTVSVTPGFSQTTSPPSEIEELRSEVEQLRRESQELKAQLRIIREQLGLTGNPAVDRSSEAKDDRISALAEEQALLNAKVADQYQTKIESGSKYRVRLSGLALVNAFSTRGSVDSLDLPAVANLKQAGDSNGSFGFSVRQSRLDLAVFGPDWHGAKTKGEASIDFWGGFPVTSAGLSSGLIRLRTATLTFDSPTTTIVAGQDVPFFSPRSPTSLASTAHPALSSSGNLWTWVPQVHVERRFAVSDSDSLSIQGGVLDPFTGESPGEYDRAPTAGERSGMPAYATRVGWKRVANDGVAAVGAAAYYSRQDWRFGRRLDSWLAAGDWDLPITRTLSLSGEFYRGRAIGGLGAGAAGSVLFEGPSTLNTSRALPLNSIGGWSQLKYKPFEQLEFNGAFGQDQSYRAGIRNLLNQGAIEGSPISRNASSFINVIYQARSNLLFSIEYRRLWTYGFTEPKRNADYFSVTSGIVF